MAVRQRYIVAGIAALAAAAVAAFYLNQPDGSKRHVTARVDPPPEFPAAMEASLGVGSQRARDDLYCSGLLAQPLPPAGAPAPTAAQKSEALELMRNVIRLSDSGVASLIAAKEASAALAVEAAAAQQLRARIDRKAGTTRIDIDDCTARAEDLRRDRPDPAPAPDAEVGAATALSAKGAKGRSGNHVEGVDPVLAGANNAGNKNVGDAHRRVRGHPR